MEKSFIAQQLDKMEYASPFERQKIRAGLELQNINTMSEADYELLHERL